MDVGGGGGITIKPPSAVSLSIRKSGAANLAPDYPNKSGAAKNPPDDDVRCRSDRTNGPNWNSSIGAPFSALKGENAVTAAAGLNCGFRLRSHNTNEEINMRAEVWHSATMMSFILFCHSSAASKLCIHKGVVPRMRRNSSRVPGACLQKGI